MNRRRFLRVTAAAAILPQLPLPKIPLPVKSPWLMDISHRDVDFLGDKETLDKLTLLFTAYYKKKYLTA